MTDQRTPWIHVDLPLAITAETPLHVGAGHGEGLLRKALMKAPDQADARRRYQPYIPGSSLKGRVRNLCEDLCRGLDRRVCGVPRVGEDDEGANHQPKRCLICRIFGAIGESSAEGRSLNWRNAYPALAEREFAAQTLARTHVQLSRPRGMASAQRLFTVELTSPGITFHGRVTGWVEGTECPSSPGFYYEVALLLAGLLLTDSLGGMRRRGAGRCSIALPSAVDLKIDGAPRLDPLDDLLRPLEALREFDDQVGGARGA